MKQLISRLVMVIAGIVMYQIFSTITSQKHSEVNINIIFFLLGYGLYVFGWTQIKRYYKLSMVPFYYLNGIFFGQMLWHTYQKTYIVDGKIVQYNSTFMGIVFGIFVLSYGFILYRDIKDHLLKDLIGK